MKITSKSYSLKETAKKLKISDRTLYRWCQLEKVKASIEVPLGTDMVRRFTESDIKAIKSNPPRTTAGRPPSPKRRLVLDYAKANPNKTAHEIGTKFRLSAKRVYAILADAKQGK